MSESNPNAEHFDVFLCHNSEDKPEIRQISDELSRRGLKPWLDEREMQPGKPWQEVLETQIETIKVAAVFVGKSGIGPWQNVEMRAFINEFVERACPVIPVMLRSATETPKLPILLKSLHCVDFRKVESEPIKQLIWGITGKKPDHQSNDESAEKLENVREAGGEALVPSRAKQIIELRLPGNVEQFSSEQQMAFIQSVAALLKIGEVKVTRVVAGSIRLYLELNQEDADKLYSASKAGQLAELSISEARLYPAIAVPPDHEQRAQLLILLDRVQEYWVDGVLKQSLYHEVLISLGKHAVDEAVEPPWKHVIALPDQRRHLLLQDRNINTVFDATGLLLILGEPGSGKTTCLLELAAALILRAKSDPKERVPIVLNLSSWKKTQSLDEWMAAELSAKYRIPMPIARDWLGKDYLVPLLDGLDEVQTALQSECVAAINEFIGNNKPSGLVVCCRLAEYRWLPERLRLNGAICLEPLSLQDVNKFLTVGGPQLAGLRHALKGDPVLQEVAETPLMLSIMSLACEGVDGEALSTHKDDSPMVRRDQVFRLYVDRMFERKGSSTGGFSKDMTIGWLSWLARKMREQSQSVFMVEELQPSWLSSRGQRLAYEAVTSLGIGLVSGLAIGLYGGAAYGISLGMIFVGLLRWVGIVSLNEIHPVEVIRWDWELFWKKMRMGSLEALLSPALLLVGIAAGQFSGVLNFGKGDKVFPNQGIKLSLKNGLAGLSIGGLVGGLFMLPVPLLGASAPTSFMVAVFSYAMFSGLLVGFYCGGSAVVKHYALRLVLWLTGSTPFRFIPFLDHCAKLILLKKVGGGYMFVHRTLLEYFSALSPEAKKAKETSPGSAS
ncbi:MAG: TIR domain-containing protein [Nitrospira sp. LK70]|nr:TIR domain-containing protein [Nitrospira sp. LK70]